MRWLIAGLFALLAASPAAAAALRPADLASTEAVLHWISGYRSSPMSSGVPRRHAARLSRFGAFNDPERCGVYVGFLAGVIGSNPDKAEKLVAKTMTMRERDRWIIVRAIAYSGLPEWKALLRRVVLAHAALRRDEREIHRGQDGDACPIHRPAGADHARPAARPFAARRSRRTRSRWSRARKCSICCGAIISRPTATVRSCT